MTADNKKGIGSNDIVSNAEEQTPLSHYVGQRPPPRATGPVIVGGNSSKSYMSEAEKLQAQNEARQNIFRH